MAGESARDYARRQREKAERHLRVAEMYERGANGEVATAAELDALRTQGWVVFHDVRWPGRPRANIDHVVIGPGGVFVVDSKNWSGSIGIKGNVLMQGGRRREPAVVGASEAALAITQVLGRVPATGVLCFVRDEPLNGWARDVMVCSTSTLASMLTSRPPTLHPAAVQRFAQRLRGVLTHAAAPPPVENHPLVAPPPVRASRPAATKQPRARRSAPLRLVVGLAVFLGALLLGVPIAQRLATSAIAGAAKSTVPSAKPIGTAALLPGAEGRPQLEATALRVMNARPVRGAAYVVAAGQRLIAVDVRLRNEGDQPWSMASVGTSWSVRDSAGLAHSAKTLRRVSVGRVLAPSLVVGAHRQVRGLIVFEVPVGKSATQIRLTAGPGATKEVRWTI